VRGAINPEGRGLQPPSPVKDRDTLIEPSETRINEANRIMIKQVVYDEFMNQIKTVRHSFNTTGTANYRVQLAVPLQLKITITITIIIIIILFS